MKRVPSLTREFLSPRSRDEYVPNSNPSSLCPAAASTSPGVILRRDIPSSRISFKTQNQQQLQRRALYSDSAPHASKSADPALPLCLATCSRCYARLHPRAVNCRKKKVRWAGELDSRAVLTAAHRLVLTVARLDALPLLMPLPSSLPRAAVRPHLAGTEECSLGAAAGWVLGRHGLPAVLLCHQRFGAVVPLHGCWRA